MTLTFTPSADFALRRSYTPTLYVGYGAGASLTFEPPNTIHMHFDISPTSFLDTYIVIPPWWYDWNSHTIPLNQLVVSEVSRFDGVPPDFHFNATVSWGYEAVNRRPYVGIFYDGGAHNYPLVLPPSPTDYWLRLPPP